MASRKSAQVTSFNVGKMGNAFPSGGNVTTIETVKKDRMNMTVLLLNVNLGSSLVQFTGLTRPIAFQVITDVIKKKIVPMDLMN